MWLAGNGPEDGQWTELKVVIDTNSITVTKRNISLQHQQ
jgi:hypothetical protein